MFLAFFSEQDVATLDVPVHLAHRVEVGKALGRDTHTTRKATPWKNTFIWMNTYSKQRVCPNGRNHQNRVWEDTAELHSGGCGVCFMGVGGGAGRWCGYALREGAPMTHITNNGNIYLSHQNKDLPQRHTVQRP